MSPRETIAFLLTAPSKSQAVNGFVGLAGAQMGLKYGFMSLFCIVKGQQEQEIIAELLIYDGRRPLAPLDPVSPLLAAPRAPGNALEPQFPWSRASLGVGERRLGVTNTGTASGSPSEPREGCPVPIPGCPSGVGRAGPAPELRSHALLIPPGTCPSSRRLRARAEEPINPPGSRGSGSGSSGSPANEGRGAAWPSRLPGGRAGVSAGARRFPGGGKWVN